MEITHRPGQHSGPTPSIAKEDRYAMNDENRRIHGEESQALRITPPQPGPGDIE